MQIRKFIMPFIYIVFPLEFNPHTYIYYLLIKFTECIARALKCVCELKVTVCYHSHFIRTKMCTIVVAKYISTILKATFQIKLKVLHVS